MSTTTPRSCGELSCDECDARTATLTAERDQLRAEVEAANKHCDILKESNSRACAEVERLGHLEAVLRSCAFDKDGTAWKTVCGWWSKKYDAVERQMSENATRAKRAEADAAAYLKRAESFSKIGDEAETDLATERARLDWLQEHALAQHSEGISISKLGRHYNGFPGSLRAAIDAAMKEDAIK